MTTVLHYQIIHFIHSLIKNIKIYILRSRQFDIIMATVYSKNTGKIGRIWFLF